MTDDKITPEAVERLASVYDAKAARYGADTKSFYSVTATTLRALAARLAEVEADLAFMTANRNEWQGSATQRHFRAEAAEARVAELEALVKFMPEALASLDATGCNVSLCKDIRAVLSALDQPAKSRPAQ